MRDLVIGLPSMLLAVFCLFRILASKSRIRKVIGLLVYFCLLIVTGVLVFPWLVSLGAALNSDEHSTGPAPLWWKILVDILTALHNNQGTFIACLLLFVITLVIGYVGTFIGNPKMMEEVPTAILSENERAVREAKARESEKRDLERERIRELNQRTRELMEEERKQREMAGSGP